ncbi:IS1/IS1595 family N-terminal zinc-binding domain-containing protein [Lyngbya aestuarii]|uniref:IS1/IS1595 family N-terminal zinc-binding domain-containing protein n=1 Tax=Lyngbya aestuarii TaxID=118322 RepID=UPI00403DDC37
MASMKCPRCQSSRLGKNGRANAKQRYLCKAWGRQFLRPLSTETPSYAEIQAEKVNNNGHAQPTLTQKLTLLQNYPQALTQQLSAVTLPIQKARRIAILLLDAENLNIEIKTEKFLAKLCNCHLQAQSLCHLKSDLCAATSEILLNLAVVLRCRKRAKAIK